MGGKFAHSAEKKDPSAVKQELHSQKQRKDLVESRDSVLDKSTAKRKKRKELHCGNEKEKGDSQTEETAEAGDT